MPVLRDGYRSGNRWTGEILTVVALFVSRNGPYWKDRRFICWDEQADARNYDGDAPSVSHPPCPRWGRFANGRPTKRDQVLGDDGGCFHVALVKTRANGGVLEHPADSQAWDWFNLPIPPAKGWSAPDRFGGRSCRIDQSCYGHPAQKPTWLYAVLPAYPEMDWRRMPMERTIEKMSSADPWRWMTPDALKDALHDMAASCIDWHPKMAAPVVRLNLEPLTVREPESTTKTGGEA